MGYGYGLKEKCSHGTNFKWEINETKSIVAWEVAPLQRLVDPFNQRQTQKSEKESTKKEQWPKSGPD